MTPWGATHVLGILNLTPDSFSDGGKLPSPQAALAHAIGLVEAGANWLDVGAESTRPGASPITPNIEWARLASTLHLLRQELPQIPLSLDTRHGEVARRGLEAGVAMLNDVTGFQDPAMLQVARESTVPLLAMRSRHTGGIFHMPPYSDSEPKTSEAIIRECQQLTDRLVDSGLDPARIILDPGFGFGTTYLEDRALWESLPELPHRLQWPVARICVAISRKRFTAYMTGQPDLTPTDRDSETWRLHAEAATYGYRVFRTHALPSQELHP